MFEHFIPRSIRKNELPHGNIDLVTIMPIWQEFLTLLKNAYPEQENRNLCEISWVSFQNDVLGGILSATEEVDPAVVGTVACLKASYVPIL